MNPSDNKKLEEIERKYQPKPYYQGEGFEITAHPDPDIQWLISKVKEQDREIERLQIGIKQITSSGNDAIEFWRTRAESLLC